MSLSFKKVVYTQSKPKKMRAVYEADDIKHRMRPEIMNANESNIMKSTFKVLIVSDSVRSQNIMLSVVRQQLGFTSTSVVNSAQDAFKELNERKYDIVLASYRMSDGDSMELASAIKEEKLNSKAEFIMVMDFTEYEAGNLRAAGVLALPAPFKPDNLALTFQAMYVRYLDKLLERINIRDKLDIT